MDDCSQEVIAQQEVEIELVKNWQYALVGMVQNYQMTW